MVSLERAKRQAINFYDDQEVPNYLEAKSKPELLADDITSGEIFVQEDSAAPKIDDLINTQSSLNAALYQVRSLIEMIDVCGNTENTYYSHSLPVKSGKYLSIKPLNTQRSVPVGWCQRIGLKYKSIQESANYITGRVESIRDSVKLQQVFIKTLFEVNKRWKIIQQGNSIFAVIGKSKGKEVKVMILKDADYCLKVELPSEMKVFKVLHVEVKCNLIDLPDLKLKKSSQFEELERASQVLVDNEIYTKISNEMNDSQFYFVRKVTNQEIKVQLSTDDELDIQVGFVLKENFAVNGLYKNILERLNNEKREDILEEFCRVVIHSHLKVLVFKIIIESLEENDVKYKLKEKEHDISKVVFTIFSDTSKCKVVDIEVNGNEILCTSYSYFCMNKFIPMNPRTKIFLREIKPLILHVIELQVEYLKLILESS